MERQATFWVCLTPAMSKGQIVASISLLYEWRIVVSWTSWPVCCLCSRCCCCCCCRYCYCCRCCRSECVCSPLLMLMSMSSHSYSSYSNDQNDDIDVRPWIFEKLAHKHTRMNVMLVLSSLVFCFVGVSVCLEMNLHVHITDRHAHIHMQKKQHIYSSTLMRCIPLSCCSEQCF